MKNCPAKARTGWALIYGSRWFPSVLKYSATKCARKFSGLSRLQTCKKYRGFWDSLQPASLTDPTKIKTTTLVTEDGGKTWIAKDKRPYTVKQNSPKIYYSRSRIKSDLPGAVKLLEQWAAKEGFALKEQKKAPYMVYYNAVKNIGGKDMIIYLVAATMPDDPGNVHVSFRSWDKPDVRKPLEEAIDKGEQAIWAGGRKVEGR